MGGRNSQIKDLCASHGYISLGYAPKQWIYMWGSVGCIDAIGGVEVFRAEEGLEMFRGLNAVMSSTGGRESSF